MQKTNTNESTKKTEKKIQSEKNIECHFQLKRNKEIFSNLHVLCVVYTSLLISCKCLHKCNLSKVGKNRLKMWQQRFSFSMNISRVEIYSHDQFHFVIVVKNLLFFLVFIFSSSCSAR